jgi:ATP-dependent Clp protease ATP-binding subunit ClpB
MERVRAAFRPEFLNRLDEILLFHRLFKAQMARIVEIQLDRLSKRLADRNITVQLDDKAKAWLAQHGYDPVYGARPLKRVIQRHLENPLAMSVLEGKIADGSTVRISAGEDGIVIDGRKIKAAA